MPTSVAAIVPLRAPGSKTRLARGAGDAPGLSPHERAALAAAMLADVAAALGASPVDDVVVAAGGAEAAAAAAAAGLDAVRDPPGTAGLDAAVAAAARVLAPTAALLVVAADLPCLSPSDVTALLAAPAHVAVAPTSDGGTGGLLRRPPTAIPTAYGPGSARRHLALAAEAGIDAANVALEGFHRDIDTWADLTALRTAQTGPATTAFLRRLDLRLPTRS